MYWETVPVAAYMDLKDNWDNANLQQLVNVIIMNWRWSTTERERERESDVQDDYSHVNFWLSVLKVTNLINWYDTVGDHLGYQCNYQIIEMKIMFYMMQP